MRDVITERTKMKIAVLSGKGGTGKTMLSVNLAAVATPSTYVDCDVEEPNGYLFFKPEDVRPEIVSVLVPSADPNICNGCKECVRFCKFHALAHSGEHLIVFEDVCHSCGGCSLICPLNAITEHPRTVGVVESGRSGEVTIHTGRMNVGEAAGLPIIRKLMKKISESGQERIFIDCPPGSSCTVMESIRDAEFCVLVSEPTIFGAHNLEMIVELVRTFDKPFGVILNKRLDGEKDPSEEYCHRNCLPILGKIPFDHELGILNSEGKIASRENGRFFQMFKDIYDHITECVSI